MSENFITTPMKNIVYIYILTIITFFGYTSTSLAQEGSESAAEASVSGSASQPAVNPPYATDSNPIVTVVRAGIPVQQVLSGSISLTQVLSFAKSSGDMATLTAGANLVSQGKDVSLVTDFFERDIKDTSIVGSAIDLGLNVDQTEEALELEFALDEAKDAIDKGLTLDTAKIAKDKGLTFDEAKNATDTGLSFDEAKEAKDLGLTFDEAKEAIDAGLSLDDPLVGADSGTDLGDYVAARETILSLTLNNNPFVTDVQLDLLLVSGLSTDQVIELHAAGISYATILDGIDNGFNSDQIISFVSKNLTTSDVITLQTAGFSFENFDQYSKAYAEIFTESISDELDANIKTLIDTVSSDYSVENFQVQLAEAVTVANMLLQDQTITDSLPSHIISSTIFSSGYNYELARLLIEYGAIGDKGSVLASDILGPNYSSFSTSGALSVKDSTSDYLSYLATLTGSATFGDIDAKSSVLSVPMENVKLAPGANITIGQSGSSSTVSVGDHLKSANGIDADRKILVVGAAKDINTAGNISFTNSNKNEDHALVIGAADNVMINHDITYDAGNLAIGSGDQTSDSMWIANTKITSGGNLAVGSLGTLNISNTEFMVGQANLDHYDPDNVYLYANDLIQINGLSFSGSKLDDVYMEGKTLNLKDVFMPATADVMLKSKDGTLHFDTFSAPQLGGVNLTNVRHGSTTLEKKHFDGVPGHHDSSIILPNGTPAIKIRKQY